MKTPILCVLLLTEPMLNGTCPHYLQRAQHQEYPNIVVAGLVPGWFRGFSQQIQGLRLVNKCLPRGETYEKMVLPVLSPDPNTNATWHAEGVRG